MSSVDVQIEVPLSSSLPHALYSVDPVLDDSPSEDSSNQQAEGEGDASREETSAIGADEGEATQTKDAIVQQGGKSDKATPAHLPVEVWERILFHMDPIYMHKMAQVSRRHYTILKSPFFQARYFCTRHMPCQAIYYASCRPKLFTPELFQCLLSLGAIMSRYFAQSFLQRHLGLGKLRGNPKWAFACSSTVLTAVLGEGTRLYGDDIKFTISTSDGTEVRSWAENPARLPVLNDVIRDIFIKGKFAVFTADDLCFQHPYSSYMPLANAIAHHPELLQMLIANGYEFQSSEQNRIVSCIFHRITEDKEQLYERLKDILERFPDWRMSAFSNTAEEYLLNPHSTTFAPVAATEEGRALLAANEGIGPIKVAVKVMKRLYDEGKAFLDMDESAWQAIRKILRTCMHKPCRENAPALRVLYKLFPTECEDVKIEIATSYICHFEHEFKEASPLELSRGHQDLFDLLEELALDEIDYIELATSEDIAYDKFLLCCIQRGIFGVFEDMTEKQKQDWVTYYFARCLEHPMTGHHLEEMETACKALYLDEKTTARRNKKAQALMMDCLESAVMDYGFNLETLKPDRKQAVEQKLRSPLAWLTKGAYTVLSNNSYYPNTLLLPDIHGLFPPGPRPHNGNESVDLTFVETRQVFIDMIDAIEKEAAEAELKGSGCHSSNCEGESKVGEQGWQHLGHIDELSSAADDSGVVIIPTVSKAATASGEEETEKIQESIHSTTSTKATKKKAVRVKGKGKQSVKIGHFPTSTIRVIRALCSVCSRGPVNCCGYQLPYHRKAKDMALELLSFLPASSPALQDVLMAHALINGNESLLETMMNGAYGGDETGGGRDVKPVTKPTTNHAKGRHGQPEKPILPTLAHLRILQAVERKPVQKFIHCIIEGAPFKTGHVDANLQGRSEDDEVDSGEDELGVRRKWYEVSGHKDDPRLTSLFEEKRRLEEQDKGGKKKGRTSKKASSRKSQARASTKHDDGAEEEEDDDEMNDFSLTKAVGQAAGSSERTSTRSHLKRSTTKKPIHYVDEFPLTSEEENSEDKEKESRVNTKAKKAIKKVQTKKKAGSNKETELDESKVLEMLGDDQRAAASNVEFAELFGNGSDLSDLSSDAGDLQKDEKNESEEEITDEDEEDLYGFDRDDVPIITLDLENVEHKIPLNILKRRWQSLSLWQEHLRLLLWFERRKERLVKEKAAKLREAGRSWERAGKSKFSLALSEMIRRVESVCKSMDEALQPALRTRRLAMIKAIREKSRRSVKVEAEAPRVNATRMKSKKSIPSKRKHMRDNDGDVGASSPSVRKKLRILKGGAKTAKD